MIGFASSATPGGAEGGEAASESKEGGEHATLTPITFEGASCLIKILNTKQTTACNLSVVRMVYFLWFVYILTQVLQVYSWIHILGISISIIIVVSFIVAWCRGRLIGMGLKMMVMIIIVIITTIIVISSSAFLRLGGGLIGLV